MPDRCIPFVVLAACGLSDPGPADTTAECAAEIVDIHAASDICPRNYPCTPNNPWSETVCGVVCGNHGYCQPYSPSEITFCELFPGRCYRLDPSRCCDAWGNPVWATRCVPDLFP